MQLLRGCKEEVAIAKEFSLTTALKKCHDDAAKASPAAPPFPLVSLCADARTRTHAQAASRTSSAAVNLCESAGKRLDLLSASIWNVYKNFTNFAKPLAEEAGDSMVKGTLAAAAKTAETAGRFANWLPNVASPAALKYTVKSGSMKGGSFTIDLGRNTIVGAFVATNKRRALRHPAAAHAEWAQAACGVVGLTLFAADLPGAARARTMRMAGPVTLRSTSALTGRCGILLTRAGCCPGRPRLSPST